MGKFLWLRILRFEKGVCIGVLHVHFLHAFFRHEDSAADDESFVVWIGDDGQLGELAFFQMTDGVTLLLVEGPDGTFVFQ